MLFLLLMGIHMSFQLKLGMHEMSKSMLIISYCTQNGWSIGHPLKVNIAAEHPPRGF
jgi:hypothetical protein